MSKVSVTSDKFWISITAGENLFKVIKTISDYLTNISLKPTIITVKKERNPSFFITDFEQVFEHRYKRVFTNPWNI